MKNALRWIGRGFMWLCTAVVVLGGLVYVVGQIVGIPVQPTYETVAHAALPGEQQPAPPLPPADSARLGENARRAAPADSAAPVQNVIFLIGDGMGLSMLSTVDALAERRLAMGRMPVTGLVRTHSLTGPISDSGAGATAMATGFKTTNYTIGMTPDGRERLSILEAAARQGMATGVVTTSYLTDATPAGFTAHLPSRSNYAAIARQMIASRADVLLGGGQPTVFTDSLRRAARRRGFSVGDSLGHFTGTNATAAPTARWLGLFSERAGRFDVMHGPPLPEVTAAALRKLRQRGERFFLVVEQEGTDAAGHINRLPDARRYLRELDRAVERALRFARHRAHARSRHRRPRHRRPQHHPHRGQPGDGALERLRSHGHVDAAPGVRPGRATLHRRHAKHGPSPKAGASAGAGWISQSDRCSARIALTSGATGRRPARRNHCTVSLRGAVSRLLTFMEKRYAFMDLNSARRYCTGRIQRMAQVQIEAGTAGRLHA
ncbi:MAG: hypothetical protein BRD52_02830 [Bacteroidetes bacterium SW_4_67_19]|nr:MAG: hypothetical protein BRD52_02830 [Bacteroidetes bacterium SW_4_67_19]